ncbi:MAG: ATP-binding protein [Devosia sp.]
MHRATFSGTIDGVVGASTWLRELATREGFPDKLAFALEVCLEELFTNVIRHGGAGTWDEKVHADLPDPLSVTLKLEAAGDTVTLTVEDNGHPFDVSEATPRKIGEPIEQVLPGGLGVQLIRSFSQSLRYEPLARGNRVLLTFLREQLAETKAAS